MRWEGEREEIQFISQSEQQMQTRAQQTRSLKNGKRKSIQNADYNSQPTVSDKVGKRPSPYSQSYSGYQVQPVQGQQRGCAYNFQDVKFGDLPLLQSTKNEEEMMSLLRRKINECCLIYNFKGPSSKANDKQLKRQTLLELVEFLNGADGMPPSVSYSEEISAELFRMIEVNIFRAFGGSGSGQSKQTLDPDEEEPNLEEAWPHLQIIYELLLRYIISMEVQFKLARSFLNNSFIVKLLNLFNSEDPRERDYLKTIVHRMYGRFMPLRSYIRKSIQNIFFKVIYEKEEHNGIAELLQVLGSVISGFQVPLKEEHKHFLEKALIPLHKTHSLAMYHSQLSSCIKQFLDKDAALIKQVIEGLLRFWPITNASKEVLFLNEIEDFIDSHNLGEQSQEIKLKFFKRICTCITSSHFQVAERSLFLWNNDKLIKLVTDNKEVIFPIAIKGLLRNSKFHWNTTVQGLTYNVLKILMELDQNLFQKTSLEAQEAEEEQQKRIESNLEKWKALERSLDI